MKTLGKIMFVGLSLLVAMPAGAVVVSTGKTFKGRSPQFLNHKFCKDNQIRLVVEEEKKNGDYGHTTDRYVVYDEKLNEIGSFKVPDFPEVSSSYTRAEAINGPFGIHEGYVQDDIEAENMSQEVFIEMASSRGGILMDETYYLFVDARTKNDNENVSLVFEVNPRSASINMVGAPIGMRVSPTTPQRGADVTVDLGAAAGENCRVNVVSVSGNTVISAVVEPGAESMSLSTSRLDRGMYIVTVTDGNSSREATKIIVR